MGHTQGECSDKTERVSSRSLATAAPELLAEPPAALFAGKKTPFYAKNAIILPRQARDEHSGKHSKQKSCVVFAADGGTAAYTSIVASLAACDPPLLAPEAVLLFELGKVRNPIKLSANAPV